MRTYLWCIFIHCTCNIITCTVSAGLSWGQGSTYLPRAATSSAVCSNEANIFILGGQGSESQFVEYVMDQDTFIDHGSNNLSTEVDGDAQHWTQQAELCYMINPQSYTKATGNTFNVFNMATKQYTAQWKSVTMQSPVGENGCLASTNEYLFVVGGHQGGINDMINTLQILSLTTFGWIDNTAGMNTIRGRHACIVHGMDLYAFGGFGTTYLSSNEYISVANVSAGPNGVGGASWAYIDPLTHGIYGPRAAAYEDNIYIMGGKNGPQYVNTVHVLDTTTKTIVLSSGRLPYSAGYGSAISISGAGIYFFGGQKGAIVYHNTWAFGHPPTSAPTQPTALPSVSPSEYPTTSPSVYTGAPTNAPTVDTISPTLAPSNEPTGDSLAPSNAPSQAPVIYTTMGEPSSAVFVSFCSIVILLQLSILSIMI